MKCLFVIDRNFFAGLDIAQSEEQHVTIHRPHVGVWLAGMIHVMSAVAAARTVQTEATVDVADAQDATLARALLSFEVSDSFAGVFGYLLAARKKNGGETAFAVYFRFAD